MCYYTKNRFFLTYLFKSDIFFNSNNNPSTQENKMSFKLSYADKTDGDIKEQLYSINNYNKQIMQLYSYKEHRYNPYNTPKQIKNNITTFHTPSIMYDINPGIKTACYKFIILYSNEYYNYNKWRIFQRLQEAYWWYKDIWVAEKKHPADIISFATFIDNIKIFINIKKPRLVQFFENINAKIPEWIEHSKTTPVYGAICLSSDLKYCLMINEIKGTYWGFPKGKIEEEETFIDGACREVAEEIGLNIIPYVNSSTYIIKVNFNNIEYTYYIVHNIPWNVRLKPLKNNEIKKIAWIPINSLSNWKNNAINLDLNFHTSLHNTNLVNELEKYIDNYINTSTDLNIPKIDKADIVIKYDL